MTDVTSPYEKNVLAGNILRVMRAKQNDTVMKYDRATEVTLQYLENWDGVQSEIDVATTICNVFLNRLCIDALGDELGTELLHEFMYINNVPIRTISNMLRDENNILWDDVRSPQKELRDTIIRWSFLRTVQHLTKMLGNDVRGWNWGKLHSLTYRHPFSTASDVVAGKSNVASGYARGGSTTVAQASYSFWKPYEQRVGPSMRMVADMKTNILYAILPTGNSGNMFSPHYGNMAKMFKQGEMIPLTLTAQNKPVNTLRLIPKE
jgi:penicillin amidase